MPMAEKTRALVLQLKPKYQELRGKRTYTEASPVTSASTGRTKS